jgi:hypothetical protein
MRNKNWILKAENKMRIGENPPRRNEELSENDLITY